MLKSSHQIRNRILLIGLILVIAALVSSCGGSAFAASSWPGLTVDTDTAYLAYGPAVFAINLNTGQELWRYPREPDPKITFYAPPAISPEGHLIIGGYDNKVYALDPATGDALWPQPFDQAEDRFIGAPIIIDDVILAPAADGRLFALELATGFPLWQEPFQAGENSEPLWSAPVVHEGRIYLSSLDHHLYVIDLESGEEIWRTEDLGAAIADSPTIADGLILLGTFGSQLIAIDSDSFELLWTFDTEGWVWGNPVVGDGIVYFGDTSGIAYAVHLDNGEELWHKKINEAIAASPTLKDGQVFFVTETGTVHAADATTGGSLWPTDPKFEGSKLLADPIVHEEKLLISTISTECVIYEINTQSGANRCLFQPTE